MPALMHDVSISTASRDQEPLEALGGPSATWTSDALCQLAEAIVSPGTICVEIDHFLSGLRAPGRTDVPPYDLRNLIPVGYVQEIMKDGLEFEGRFAVQIEGNTLVGMVNGDFEPRFGFYDSRFTSPPRALRVRTLDTHLEGLPRMALLILGEHAAQPGIVRSGRNAIGTDRPIVALSPATSEELKQIFAALREINDSYRLIPFEVPRPLTGEDEPLARAIWIAAPQPHDQMVEDVVAEIARRRTLFRRKPQKTALRSAAYIDPTSVLRDGYTIRPDQFVGSAGFHPVEQDGQSIWRWGGALPRLSIFLEVESPGFYEIYIGLANALEGAVESIKGIRVNGTLIIDSKRTKGDWSFAVEAPLYRHALVEIHCGVRHRVGDDHRMLNIALSEVRIRPLTRSAYSK